MRLPSKLCFQASSLSVVKDRKPKPLLNKPLKALVGLLCMVAVPFVSADVFINEIHYDNAGGDVDEAIEIAGDANTDLSGWSLVFYNGNNSQSYMTTDLTGLIPNQQDGMGTLIFTISGIQNGAPDGVALVDNSAQVVQFLSYEGAFTATNGAANGMTSSDIGVSEVSSTAVGNSLQLSGTGSQASDFSWEAASVSTYGAVNINQTFGAGGPQVDLAPTVIETTPADQSGVIALNSNIEISFSEGVNLSDDWFTLSCDDSGDHSVAMSGGPQHYTLDPDIDFVNNEICSMSIVGALVSDLDDNDPPDTMESDVEISFATQVDSTIRINEVDADTAGSDSLEFVELYDGGVGNTPLDGLVVVLYNGSDLRSYNEAFDLDGFKTNAEGYFVLGNADVVPSPSLVINNNSLQNGADAVALYVGNSTDYPNDTDVSGFGLIDAIVYDTSDADSQGLLSILTPNHPQINENGGGDKNSDSNARIPDGGAAIDTAVYNQQLPTPGASNVAEADIFAIQGTGMDSPFEGSYVRTLGNIVTAVDTNGFFIQTPEARTDADDNTSDGVFVFTGSAPTVMVGDEVNVEGRIVEYFGFTEYSGGVLVTTISSGNTLPSAIEFSESMPSHEQPQAENEMERFEGMLVSFEGIASAATDRFGDTQVVAGEQRPFREPGIEYPGETDVPVWDGNPEIFEIDPNALGGDNATLYAGQRVKAMGPLGFSFGDYQVWPTKIAIGKQPKIVKKIRQGGGNEMTVGGLNMYRLFDSVDDPDVDDEVVPEDEYQIRLSKISRFVVTVMGKPDILVATEVENLSVLNTLADTINSLDPQAHYRAYLEEGNDIGGIDIGFLVRDSIVMDEIVQFGKDEILDYDGSLLNDRPPLLFKGRSIANKTSFPFEVLGVHNRSLGGISSSGRGARVRAKRLAQAQFVGRIVQDIQTANPQVNLVVTGDFNAYQFSDGYVDVVGQITGASVESENLLWEPSVVEPMLTNQVDNMPIEERYSFVFGGSAQVLDHSLTSSHLTPMVRGAKFARGNSDLPSNLVLDDAKPLRSSDHDGIVLFIKKHFD